MTKSITDNSSNTQDKSNVIDKHLNLTEYEKYLRKMHGLSSHSPSQFSHGIEQTPNVGSHDEKEESKCNEPPRFGSLPGDGEPTRLTATSKTPKQSSIWIENPIVDSNSIVIRGAKRSDIPEVMAGK